MPSATTIPMRFAASFLAAASLLALVSPSLAQSANKPIERLIRDSAVADAKVAVAAIDLDTNETLVSINEREAMIPASNMKLMSTGAALLVLGADHAYQTSFNRLDDTIIIVGSGDPALGDPALLNEINPDLTPADLLDGLSTSLRNAIDAGVREIVLDDRVFDREYQHPTWDPADVNKSWQPEVAGLGFHANSLYVYTSASPDGLGARPTVRFEPNTGTQRVDIRARTATSGRTTAWIARSTRANDFKLYGKVRGRSQNPIRVPVHEPQRFFGEILAERLASSGEERPSVRLAEELELFEDAQVVAVVTTPLEDVVTRCNTVSQNLYAESMLKSVGHAVTGAPGSFTNGAAAIRMLVAERLSPDDARQVIIADGSGLSRDNRLTPRVLVRWLASFDRDDELGPIMLDSLATPGHGTLRTWFRDEPINARLHAKTGYLTGVRALSGYLITDNRRVAFSILVNDVSPNGGSAEAKKLVQRIVRALDAHIAGGAPAAQTLVSPGADHGG